MIKLRLGTFNRPLVPSAVEPWVSWVPALPLHKNSGMSLRVDVA